MIPCKREKHILLATVVSAALNVGLNFVLIPVFNESAAALTTLVAEACSLAICIYNSRNLIKIKFQWKDILSTVLGCFAVFFICKATLSLNLSSIVTIITGIIASVIGYALILLVLRNSIAKFVVGEIIKKVFK